MSDDVPQALGRIEGKLDQVIDSFKEHRDDDKRRFSEVFGVLDKHSAAINQAKGAKAAVLAAAGVAGGAVAALYHLGKELLGK